MTTYGVTSSGFVTKTFDVLKQELDADILSTFGASFDVTPQSVAGQLNGIMAERLSQLWDLAAAIYASFSPNDATGAALDALAAITGTVRDPPRRSLVTVTATGVNGTVIQVGKVFKTADTGARFQVKTAATIASGTAAVECESVEYGPIAASSGTLTEIETAIAGLASVTNALDADLGATGEADSALRFRRETELHSSGNAALDAIAARVRAVDGVTSVKVFENDTYITDVNGLPPKSFEVVVIGGLDADIADAILSVKPAGIYAHGDINLFPEDSEGSIHEVRFSRPTEVNIYFIATLEYDPETYPSDGDTQVENAILAWGTSSYGLGRDVKASALAAQAFTISGVRSCVVTVGTAPAPVGTSVAIGTQQLAAFDSSRGSVSSSAETP